jgi:hypothetical protein
MLNEGNDTAQAAPPTDADPTERDPSTRIKESILTANISAAKKARAEFIETGKEIELYGYNKESEIDDQTAGVVPFKAKIAKTAQAIEIFVPELYQQNPNRRVEPRAWANPAAVKRAELMEQYLNYTAGETGLCDESRKAVTESIVYGRGVLWTGWDPRKRLVKSVYDGVCNLLVDADARSDSDVNWKGRKRVKPRWWLIARWPEKKALIEKLDADAERPSDQSRESDFTTDMVTFYECYYRVGLHNYRGGDKLLEKDEMGKLGGDDSPMKYSVTEGGVLLAEEPWEVPWHLDDQWPCQELDLRDRPGKLWPPSPLAPGLPHQKALNWIYRLYMAKMRVSTRTLIAVVSENGQGLEQEEIDKAVYGDGLYEVLRVVVNGAEGKKLSDFLQTLNITSGVEEFERFVQIVSKEFEQATGLYEILYYGDTGRQIRSAAEVEMKDRNSRSRLVDMREKVERWATKVARKEAIAARFLQSGEDIARIFGPEAGQAWGFLMPPLAVEVQQQEEQMIAQGAPPEVAQQLAQIEGEGLTQQRQAAGGVVFENTMLEVDYTIESGSMRRRDIDQRIDAANEAMNQLVPTLLQSGAQLPASAIMLEWARANGMGRDVVGAIQQFQNQLMAPPPPPPGAPMDPNAPPPPGGAPPPDQGMAPPGPPPEQMAPQGAPA